MATDVERVRLKIGDRTKLQRKQSTGDGVSRFFKMDHEPISGVEVWINDVSTSAFTVDESNGVVEFTTVPNINSKIVFQYSAMIWTDDEITDFLDQYSSNVNIASAHILLAMAADIAKIAKRETLSGGGGLGAVTRDTSVAARELRQAAEALLEYEAEYGTTIGSNVPADGLTEVPWTEAAYEQSATQRIIREN